MLRRLRILAPLLLLLAASISAACTTAAPPMPTTPTAVPPPALTPAAPLAFGGLTLPASHRPGASYPRGVASLRDLIGLGLVLPQGDPLGLDDVIRALHAEGWEVRGLPPTWVNCGVLIPSALLVTNDQGISRAVDVLVYTDAQDLEHQWTTDDAGAPLPREGASCAASNTRLVQTFGGGVESQSIPPLASARVANVIAAIPPAYGQQDLDIAFTAAIISAVASIEPPESRLVEPPDAIARVIDEAMRGDLQALASRAVLVELECVSQPGDAAALRCPDGAADGDTFEVFTSVACHAERHLADRIADAFSAFDSSEDVALYAVTEQPLGGSGLPVATHKLIFQVGDSGVALWVDQDGGIALLERACGVDTGPEVLLDDDVPVLVGPLM